MRAEKRHIILLLDNAPAHKAPNLVLTNVKLCMLPPNTTAFLQPMDAGIIAATKSAYRRRQMERAIDLVEDVSFTGKPYAVDQLQAMRWIKDIWGGMPQKNHCELLSTHEPDAPHLLRRPRQRSIEPHR